MLPAPARTPTARFRRAATAWVTPGAHTATGAAALAYAAGTELPDRLAGAGLAFCAVCTHYAAAMILRAPERGDARSAWAREHPRLMAATVGVAAAGGLALATGCERSRLINLAVVAALGLAYTLPFPGLGWRRIGPLKPVLLATAWTLLTTPWSGGAPIAQGLRWPALFALCLLFDLKDIACDRRHGVVTPAASLGPAGVRALAALLVAATTLAALACGRPDAATESAVLGVTALVAVRGADPVRIVLFGDGAMILAGAARLVSLSDHFP